MLLRLSETHSEYPADTPTTTEPEPVHEIIIQEVVTEQDSWMKWATVLNIILWILFFMGAFDD